MGFCVLVTLIITFKTDNSNDGYEKAQNDIKEMVSQKDSLFELADEVLDVVIQEKKDNDSIFSDLGDQVRNGEMTIEQQLRQVRRLLKDAEESNKFALEQKDIAEEMQKMSILQKEQSELARMKSEKRYHLLMEENKILSQEIERLNQIIDSLEKSDTLLIDKIKDKKNKKNRRDKKNL